MVRVTHSGRVSVIVVNYDGADDTLACVESLRDVEVGEGGLEIVIVDNGSPADDAARIAAAVPDAHVVALKQNVGFAAGCNAGVARATGEYLAFLNNDARPHPDWLGAALAPLQHDGSIACVASKVLGWDGSTVDYVGAALSYYGHGFKVDFGKSASAMENTATDVLFASGAAMVIRADVFRRVGGFDERYFMFFEDVDLGWRLWLLGYRVRYVPGSIAYHRHHATRGPLRGVARALPARAQRTVHDLQELRRRQPQSGAARRAPAGDPARHRTRRRRRRCARPGAGCQHAGRSAPDGRQADARTGVRNRRLHRRAPRPRAFPP